MRVLVTGNLGYIGCVLVEELQGRGYEVVGYDTDYYEGSELCDFARPAEQIIKDIRDAGLEDVRGVDAVVHLAALSNDPLGELDWRLTNEINRDATIRLGRIAKEAGVRRFVYSSSQSMYGISDTDAELDEDSSRKNPVTAYAMTKWEAECYLKRLNGDGLAVVCFRPSTVFGASARLRCDIVFNNLAACAYTTGRIEIKSDGTPWRPVVHVRDVCNAYIAGLEAPAELVARESFNVGIAGGNFTVRELAEAAQKGVPGSELVFTGEHGGDSRTYRVSFDKILTVLKDYYKPQWDLARGAEELKEFFESTGFCEGDFRGPRCNRLMNLERLAEEGRIDSELRWARQEAAV